MSRFKICASIAAETAAQLEHDSQEALELGADFLEIRFDYAIPSDFAKMIKQADLYRSKSVFTLRSASQGGKFAGNEKERISKICELASLQPMLLDIELDALESDDSLADLAEQSDVRLLVSWHDFDKTPPTADLSEKLTKMRVFSNYVKIVTMAQSVNDALRLLQLYDVADGLYPIFFAMGAQGVLSRVLCTVVGKAPFTYASVREPVALGQLSIKQLRDLYSKIDGNVSVRT